MKSNLKQGNLRWWGLSLAALTVLAGCGGSATPPASSGGPSAAASPSAPVSKASAPASISKPASVPAASAGGPIKIGVLEPLTGPLANVGKDNEDGFNLYLDSINNTVAGRKVEATYADTQGRADTGLTKAKELVESTGVQILAGITATPVCYAVATYVKQAQVPLAVTGNCGAENVTLAPQFKSPYLTRFSQSTTIAIDPAADWAYKQGYRKASLVVADFGGGIESGDAFARAFIERGGSIVQEQYPAQGTNDYGPFLSQLNKDADVLVAFLPGTDGLRFMDQYGNYVGGKKTPIIDLYGAMTDGPNLNQLKDKALGVQGVFVYSSALDTPENQKFLKQFAAKYPGQVVTKDAAQGYAGAEILAAAINKVNGKVEDKQAFLNALYATDIQTPKGRVRLDKNHDLVQDVYVYQVVKEGNGFGQKLLHTYNDVSDFWDITPEQLAHFPIGKMKGKWVGMTKAQLDNLLKG